VRVNETDEPWEDGSLSLVPNHRRTVSAMLCVRVSDTGWHRHRLHWHDSQTPGRVAPTTRPSRRPETINTLSSVLLAVVHHIISSTSNKVSQTCQQGRWIVLRLRLRSDDMITPRSRTWPHWPWRHRCWAWQLAHNLLVCTGYVWNQTTKVPSGPDWA